MSLRDELAALNAAISDAMAAQDLDRIMGFYTDDARLQFAGSPMIRGRADIEASFRADLAGGPMLITFETLDILEGGSLVVDVGRYTTPTRTGKYVVVYQRQQDGSLKMAVDTATSDGPSGPG